MIVLKALLSVGLLFMYFVTALAFAVRWSRRESTEAAPLVDKICFTTSCVIMIALAVPVLGVFGPFLIVACAVILSMLWAPSIAYGMFGSIFNAFDGGSVQVEARPQLSPVHAKRMQGRYDEAIADVQGQLEKFPTDFEAQMVLAELLVECKGEFDAGVAVLETILAQPHPPAQLAAALNTLADWQLKHRSNAPAARAALERIVAAFPDDVLATKAAQRISHLPSQEELISRAGPKVLILEHVEDYIKPGGGRAPVGIAQEQTAEERAEQLSARLRQFPQDTEAREQLALLYADEYGQLDWAADQLEHLIRLPHQPEREVIRWLEMLASVQRRHQDAAAAARTYQRIVQMFPSHPGAERARNQLALMGAA